MKSRWNNREAARHRSPLDLRVYTSRLLGADPDLAMHGGGNTSVKITEKNLFGEEEDLLYVKGSGWDLATIESAGYAPVRMETLLKMAALDELSDSEMVRFQRAAMTNPNAPTPSVEAILHAIIPFRFVDHTHADAVVTVTNTRNGKQRLRDIYGDTILVVPYVMPGFILAREIGRMTQGVDWNAYKGMVLLNHGVFTWSDDAKKSYEAMISLVTAAERYLSRECGKGPLPKAKKSEDLLALAAARKSVSELRGTPVLARVNQAKAAVAFSQLKNVASISTRGPITPDHIIRTKQKPLLLGKNPQRDIAQYAERYRQYFERNTHDTLSCLDPAPRWAVWPGAGTLAFGKTPTEIGIIGDIVTHTAKCIQQAEALGGWKPLPEKRLFEMEYWELEQAKLKKGGAAPLFRGKVVLVTGAGSGIGKACVETFAAQGAAVAALDIKKTITHQFDSAQIVGIRCDLNSPQQIAKAVDQTIRHWGGLDIVVSNAGIFPASESISDMSPAIWDKSLAVNLTAHQRLIQHCVPFLALGIDPTVIINASKNVPAPGPGVSAYSVAKAGLTQLARVAALEFAPQGIRVNVVHPNAVFDTSIWTDDVLQKRAKHYGQTIEEYKRNNLLKTQITSHDVARLISAMAGPVFSKTTGAQVPIDGGNERVI